MATNVWKGGAAAIAQVDYLTPGGTIEATDLFIVTINGKSISVAAGGTTVADVCDAVTAAFNASTEPEFAEITATDGTSKIILTSDTAGVPFTVTCSTTETGGGAADDQTFIRSVGTANSGPNDAAVASNWSLGVVPVDNDVVFENSSVSCLYHLDQLGTTPGSPDLTTLTVKSTFTGYIGLPRNNSHGYVEYRPTALALGTAVTAINIGEGDGNGSGRINLSVGNIDHALAINVYKTAARVVTGVPAILLTTGTQSESGDTTLTVNRGDIGVAFNAGETAVIDVIKMGYVSQQTSDAKVACGSGVTLTTVTVGGGTFIANSNITTLTVTAGTAEVRGTATVTTANVNGGTLYYNSSGTCTNMYVAGGAVLDFRQDARARTLSNATIYQGATIHDPFATVTWSAGIIVSRCALADVTVDVGENRTIMKP
jgi:hypothetical protein